VSILLAEFVVKGVPVSRQCRNKNRRLIWMNEIAAAATKRYAGGAPATADVSVEITYYYRDHRIDVDNMAKPICDALNKIIYLDDRQITDLKVMKRDLDGGRTILEMTPILARALAQEHEFIYVRVEQ
jgi:Holliday junction resolvase RusA-like endonuclease